MTIKDEIVKYNQTHREWRCVQNCVNCSLPYCVNEEETRGGYKIHRVVLVYGKARITFKSEGEAARVLGLTRYEVAKYLKSGEPIKEYGATLKYEKGESNEERDY